MIETRPSPRLGPPIAVQIIALLVGVLIIGQLATLAVVVIAPPPRPPVYRVEEIAAALKGDRMTPRFAPPLIRSTASVPPKGRPRRDMRAAGAKAELARLLGVSEDKVRLIVEARPSIAFPFGGRGFRRRDRFGDRGSADPPPPPPADPSVGPPDGAGPPPDRPVDRDGRPWGGYLGGGRHLYAGQPFERVSFVVGEMEAAYQPSPGQWMIVRSAGEGFPNAWQRRIFMWFLVCIAVLTPVGYLFARRLTAPIGRFASAADRLGRDPRAPPMTLKGPAEIGLAAAAFNEMQARLARYVEDRTAMIAAIAHDLRTPLARVQFKLQKGPPDLAADIRADLGQMEAMIAAVLAFVRDAAPAQERGPLDLLSLLEVVADDASAPGADVEVEPGPAVVVEADASALQRLFVNLVDNAVKYGGQARISLGRDGGDAVVRVSDPGPGLTPEEIERVFEPFYRVETSRSRETGGIGLGLSVARSIARAHGGDVNLTSGGGLTAIVRLPGVAGAG
jgi:signal transduction histidine kinase